MRTLLAVLSCLLMVSCTDSNRTQSNAGAKPLWGGMDLSFAQDAATANRAEVELSRIAVERGSSAEVKKFAQHMIDDHTKVGGELADLAKTKNVELSQELSPKHKQLKTQLTKLQGKDFDRRYMSAMVDDHVTTVSKFETQSRAGQDADLKSFASSNLSTLREHLEQARAVAGKVEGGGVR